MEWKRIMAKGCTLIWIYSINGIIPNMKSEFCLTKGSQKEEKQRGPLII
jgi:hypothetical protein